MKTDPLAAFPSLDSVLEHIPIEGGAFRISNVEVEKDLATKKVHCILEIKSNADQWINGKPYTVNEKAEGVVLSFDQEELEWIIQDGFSSLLTPISMQEQRELIVPTVYANKPTDVFAPDIRLMLVGLSGGQEATLSEGSGLELNKPVSRLEVFMQEAGDQYKVVIYTWNAYLQELFGGEDAQRRAYINFNHSLHAYDYHGTVIPIAELNVDDPKEGGYSGKYFFLGFESIAPDYSVGLVGEVIKHYHNYEPWMDHFMNQFIDI